MDVIGSTYFDSSPWPMFSYAPAPCEHCYCLKALNVGTINGNQQQRTRPHKRCCKCQDERVGKP